MLRSCLVRTVHLMVLLVCAALAAFPFIAHGAEVRASPFMAQKMEYNDNIFMSHTGKVRDVISTTSAGLSVARRTEKDDMELMSRLDQLLHSRHHDLDSTEQFYSGAFSRTFSPRFALSLRAVYGRDSRPDRLLFTTGLLLTATRREHGSLGLSGNYAITDAMTLSFTGNHQQERFSGSSFADFTYDTGVVTFSRDLGSYLPRTRGRISGGFGHYHTGDLKVDNHQAAAGLDHDLSEKLKLSVDAGGCHTTRGEEGTGSEWGFTGQARLSYKGEATTAQLNVSRDRAPAYDRAGMVERTGAAFSMSRRLNRELSCTLSAGYFTNRSNAGEPHATPLDTTIWFFSPGFTYEINKNVRLEGQYSFTRYRDREAGATARGNTVLLRLFVQHTLLE